MSEPKPPCGSTSEEAVRGGSVHVAVMPDDVLELLDPQPGQILADGTLGGGGHAAMIADHVGPNGIVVGVDRDKAAVAAARRRFGDGPVKPIHGNFCDLPELLVLLGLEQVDAVLLDLGVSSDQLAAADRGFSFHSDGDLDLRFDVDRGEPAWRLLNRLSEQHLADLLYQFGEERNSRRIARRVVAQRRQAPIRTARQFADIVRSASTDGRGKHARRPRIDAATRSFQALRIAVNEELKSLEIVLRRIPSFVRPGGRAAIISFHSLEDRLVKNAFRDDPRYEVMTRKPRRPSPDEISRNPRSRSAKLRVAKIVAA